MSAPPGVNQIFEGVQEKTTRKLVFTLRDENGAVIPGSSLTSLFFKLFKRGAAAGVYINGRNGTTDLKGNVDVNGIYTHEFTPADNAIVDDAEAMERHIAQFRWTYGGGKVGMANYELQVWNEANLS